MKKELNITLKEDINCTVVESKYRHGTDTDLQCELQTEWEYGAPHKFVVFNNNNGDAIAKIQFQKGPIKENGRNGISDEDLLLIAAMRLQAFQNTEYACNENRDALDHIVCALECLYSRRHRRESKGIEGTSIIDYLAEHLRKKK